MLRWLKSIKQIKENSHFKTVFDNTSLSDFNDASRMLDWGPFFKRRGVPNPTPELDRIRKLEKLLNSQVSMKKYNLAQPVSQEKETVMSKALRKQFAGDLSVNLWQISKPSTSVMSKNFTPVYNVNSLLADKQLGYTKEQKEEITRVNELWLARRKQVAIIDGDNPLKWVGNLASENEFTKYSVLDILRNESQVVSDFPKIIQYKNYNSLMSKLEQGSVPLPPNAQKSALLQMALGILLQMLEFMYESFNLLTFKTDFSHVEDQEKREYLTTFVKQLLVGAKLNLAGTDLLLVDILTLLDSTSVLSKGAARTMMKRWTTAFPLQTPKGSRPADFATPEPTSDNKLPKIFQKALKSVETMPPTIKPSYANGTSTATTPGSIFYGQRGTSLASSYQSKSAQEKKRLTSLWYTESKKRNREHGEFLAAGKAIGIDTRPKKRQKRGGRGRRGRGRRGRRGRGRGD